MKFKGIKETSSGIEFGGSHWFCEKYTQNGNGV